MTGCAFVLPLALLCGLLGQELRTTMLPGPATNVVTPTPVPPVAEPTATPQHHPAPKATAQATGEQLESYTIYAPGEDAKLHRQVVKKPPSAAETTLPDVPAHSANLDRQQYETWYKARANHTLTILLKEARSIFPPATPVPAVDIKDDLVSVNFKNGFQDANMWHSETIARLAVYSVVNTLNSDDLKRDGKTKKVQLMVDGKPLDVLGELATDEPFEPNMQLVAQS